MKILMKSTVPGSIDGIRVTTYDAGTEYDLTGSGGERDLAAAFVGAGFATEVGATPAAPVAEPALQADADPVAPPPAAAPLKAQKHKK